jgi:LPS O-antigen subunit length determinant protein (WzzB/FepE family)
MHNTIRNVQCVTQTIESPPVKYVPKFYKWCTMALWAVLGVLVVVVVLKVRKVIKR